MTTSTVSSRATVVRKDEGSQYWIVGDRLTFKVVGPQCAGAFALAESLVMPGGGPPPHIHHREHEIFYILEGRLRLGLGNTAVERGPGSAVFLPKGVVHQFRCVSATPARFLVLATPCGFDDFVAAAGYPIAQMADPARGVNPEDIARLMAACPSFGLEILPQHTFDDAPPAPPAPPRELWVLGEHVRIKLATCQADGCLTIAEITTQPGGGVPMHLHRAMDEVFYVLEGAYRFTLDDNHVIDAPAGTTLHVPPGVLHSFTNLGPAKARLLDYHLPGGFDAFFEDCGTPVDQSPAGPPTQTPLDPIRLRALLEKHGMEMPPR